ncbi:MAG: T9SS type A sorting domain-containing protein [Bacteroidales bacterium]
MKKLLLVGGLALGLSLSATAQKFESAIMAKSHENVMTQTLMPLKGEIPFVKSLVQTKKTRVGSQVIELGVDKNFYAFDNSELSSRFAVKETGVDGKKSHAIVYYNNASQESYGDFAYGFTNDGTDWTKGNRGYVYKEGEFNRAVALHGFVFGNDTDGVYTSFLASPVTKQNFNFGDFAVGSAQLGEDVANQEMDENLLNDPSNDIYNNQANQSFQIGNNIYSVYSNMDYKPDPSGQSASYNFRDQLVFVKGVWNKDTKKVDYSRKLIDLPAEMFAPTGPYYAKQPVFTADGQTGYIVLAHFVKTSEQNTDRYFYFMKTEDGGDTWSDPVKKTFVGNDVCDAIKQTIPDATVYDQIIARNPSKNAAAYTGPEALKFYTLNDFDVNIDKNGELHMLVNFTMVYNAEKEGYVSFGLGPRGQALTHIYTSDKGSKWNSELVAFPDALRFTIAKEDGYPFFRFGFNITHRPQIITNEAQDKLAFVWSDTKIDWNAEKLTDITNVKPSLFGATYSVEKGKYYKQTKGEMNDFDIPVVDMTKGIKGADAKMLMIEAPHTLVEADNGNLIVPIVFSGFSKEDSKDFTYKEARTINYLSGLSLEAKDPVGLETIENVAPSFEVSQNIPNPCSENAFVTVSVPEVSNVSMDIISMTGQKVMSIDKGAVEGDVQIDFDASGLNSGVYFYTVNVDGKRITKKMIVE